MVTNAVSQTSTEEHKLLIEAATDFGNDGKTDKTCPRCGDCIILVNIGGSYLVKCASDCCIEASFRGV